MPTFEAERIPKKDVFANPFLVCNHCMETVKYTIWPKSGGHGCICMPCEHISKVDSICPSWTPVGGCDCKRIFGNILHVWKEF